MTKGRLVGDPGLTPKSNGLGDKPPAPIYEKNEKERKCPSLACTSEERETLKKKKKAVHAGKKTRCISARHG